MSCPMVGCTGTKAEARMLVVLFGGVFSGDVFFGCAFSGGGGIGERSTPTDVIYVLVVREAAVSGEIA